MSGTRVYPQLRYARPASATEILLVRHGESEAVDPRAPFALVGGRGDPALSPLGREQAEALAHRLGAAEVAAIYVTTLRRTLETAAPLARRVGLSPIVEPGLVEVHMGEWEGGLYRQRVVEGDPLALRVFAEGRFDIVPGAESNAKILKRARAAIARIAAAHPGGRVVAVSHAVTISTLLARAVGAPPFSFVLGDNGAISSLVVEGKSWTLRSFNDTGHLGALAPGRA